LVQKSQWLRVLLQFQPQAQAQECWSKPFPLCSSIDCKVINYQTHRFSSFVTYLECFFNHAGGLSFFRRKVPPDCCNASMPTAGRSDPGMAASTASPITLIRFWAAKSLFKPKATKHRRRLGRPRPQLGIAAFQPGQPAGHFVDRIAQSPDQLHGLAGIAITHERIVASMAGSTNPKISLELGKHRYRYSAGKGVRMIARSPSAQSVWRFGIGWNCRIRRNPGDGARPPICWSGHWHIPGKPGRVVEGRGGGVLRWAATSDLFDDDLDAVTVALHGRYSRSTVGIVWAREHADGS
jgi:hypothetical protein